MKVAFSSMKNHAHLSYKKIIMSALPFHRFITIFLLSFDSSLSCKLQLIDLITVSAACLAGRQTVFPENCEKGFTGKQETNGWKIKNVTGRVLLQINPSRFASRSAIFTLFNSVVKVKKNLAVDKKFSVIFCTQFVPQNAGNGISELPDFKIFWGSMTTFQVASYADVLRLVARSSLRTCAQEATFQDVPFI